MIPLILLTTITMTLPATNTLGEPLTGTVYGIVYTTDGTVQGAGSGEPGARISVTTRTEHGCFYATAVIDGPLVSAPSAIVCKSPPPQPPDDVSAN